MKATRLLFICSVLVLACGYSSAGESGAGGASGGMMPGSANVTATALYQFQLMPGQPFLGYWYFWTTGSSRSANLKLSPAVSWLALAGTKFTSASCNDVKTVLFSFTAPSVPGTYVTTIVDSLGRWDTVSVRLIVTSTPAVNDSIVMHVPPGATFSRHDTLVWSGWGRFACLTNFVPRDTVLFEYTVSPLGLLSIAGANAMDMYVDIPIVRNFPMWVDRTGTAPSTGITTAYERRTLETASYPRFIKWKIDVTPSGVEDQDGGKFPTSFALFQNYPNPFNPSTTLRYGIPRNSSVSLRVYNTLGQMISQLVNGEQQAGYHEVRFDGSNLASGVYFYRLQAGQFVETRKFILQK